MVTKFKEFPHLYIDNCASGGRRLDFEMVKRSIHLYRTDYQCIFNPEPDVTNTHHTNISKFLPVTGCSTKKKMDIYGIKVSSVGSPIGKIKLTDDFESHFEVFKNVCSVAKILGTSNIRIFSFYLRDGATRETSFNEVTEKVGELIELADNFGVVLRS